jgi:hypothetical protein
MQSLKNTVAGAILAAISTSPPYGVQRGDKRPASASAHQAVTSSINDAGGFDKRMPVRQRCLFRAHGVSC